MAKREPEPDCPRWHQERAALPHHVGKGEMSRRAAWHAKSCPDCTGWKYPEGLTPDPDWDHP